MVISASPSPCNRAGYRPGFFLLIVGWITFPFFIKPWVSLFPCPYRPKSMPLMTANQRLAIDPTLWRQDIMKRSGGQRDEILLTPLFFALYAFDSTHNTARSITLAEQRYQLIVSILEWGWIKEHYDATVSLPGISNSWC
jgi:hypothetical protein